MLAVGLSKVVFIRLGKFSSITTLMRIFFKSEIDTHFVKCFFYIYWYCLTIFFKFVIMENCIYFQMLNQPSILEVNPLCHDVLSFSLLSFSYIVELNLLTCCLQLCIYICFHSVIFDIMSFLCVVIRIMLTSVNELGSISSYSIFLKSFIALVLFLL